MRCFIIVFSGCSNQDNTTTAEHSDHTIELLQNRTVFIADIITIWEIFMSVQINTAAQLRYIYHQCWHTHITS